MSANQAGKGVWLELRIHGVHGTPPHSMLGVAADKVGQVAGDGITGIWRTEDGKVPLRDLNRPPAATSGPPRQPFAVVEAYSWGGLTSNVKGVLSWVTRVLWMFLLPFALMNLAYWARPELSYREKRVPRPSGPRARLTRTYDRSDEARDHTTRVKTSVVSARVVRIAAAGLTIFIVLTPLTVGVDLLAWQCYREGAAGCPSLPGFFDFFTNDFFSSSPQRRLVIGAVPALLAILLFWQLSRQSLSRYEAVTKAPLTLEAGLGKTTQDGPVLQDPTLWSGTSRTLRLQRLHLTLALCTVVCYTAIPVLTGTYLDAGGEKKFLYDDKPWFFWVDGIIAFAAALGMLVVAFLLLPRVRPGDLESNDEPLDEAGLAKQRLHNNQLLGAGLALTTAHLIIFLVGPTGLTLQVDQPALRGENIWFIALFLLFSATAVTLSVSGRLGRTASVVGGCLAVVFLMASSHWLWRTHPPFAWDPDDATTFWAVLCVAGGGFLLASPKKRRHGEDAAQLAWGGSGPTVLVFASVWIGLLLTTSATTYAANFLNGDQSVPDLGTSGDQVSRSIPDETGAQAGPPAYAATGDVTVRDADIQVDYEYAADGSAESATVHVLSGTVTVGTYYASDDSEGVLLGATKVKVAELNLPDDATRLDYEHSCVTPLEADADADSVADQCSLSRGEGRDGSLPAPQVLMVGEAGSNRTVAIRPTDVPQATLLLPQVLVWAPLGQLVVFIALIVVVVLTRSLLRRQQHRDVRSIVSDDARIADEDRKPCAVARTRALFPHRAERCLWWLGVPTVLVSLGIIIGAETGRAPWAVWPSASGFLQFVSAIGLWVAVGSALGLVWLASKLRTSGETARGVGILWDLTTFWPRAAHPLAPPCYAERVVPELITRINWALKEPGPDQREWGGATGVIVSAHSQGSTIAVAALSRLENEDLQRVRLVTYGSQLRTWYGRIFPGVFGPASLGNEPTAGPTTVGNGWPDVQKDPPVGVELSASKFGRSLRSRLEPQGSDAPRWVNLFRRTDPIGFRVFSDHDSTDHDRPVLEVPTSPHGDPGPKVMAHSGYPHTPEYLEVVAAWTGEARVPMARPPVSAPPLLPGP